MDKVIWCQAPDDLGDSWNHKVEEESWVTQVVLWHLPPHRRATSSRSILTILVLLNPAPLHPQSFSIWGGEVVAILILGVFDKLKNSVRHVEF